MSELGATASNAPAAGPRRTVMVGDYMGAPAAEAARAVRRLGLRAGLDRQFSTDRDTIGFVVAHEPRAGREVQRGSMVTLYVSAPTPAVREEEEQTLVEPSDERETVSSPPLRDDASSPETQRRPRRKRRARPVSTLERPQRQAAVAAAMPPADHSTAQEQSQSQSAPQASRAEDLPAEDEATWDQLAFAMRDVFRARAHGVGHGGIYPRRPLELRVRCACKRLKAHSGIAALACALLAITVSLAVERERTPSGGARGVPARSRVPAQPAPSTGEGRVALAERPRGRDSREPQTHAAPAMRRQERHGSARSPNAQAQHQRPAPTGRREGTQAGPASSEDQSTGGPFSP